MTAGLTAFYMLRAYILAFGGKGGRYGGLWGGPYRGEHEDGCKSRRWTMTIPLILLAIPSVMQATGLASSAISAGRSGSGSLYRCE